MNDNWSGKTYLRLLYEGPGTAEALELQGRRCFVHSWLHQVEVGLEIVDEADPTLGLGPILYHQLLLLRYKLQSGKL